MNNILEKLNIFDILTMIIPGMIMLCLFGLSLSRLSLETIENIFEGNYILFFTLSYLIGLILQELGAKFAKYIHKFKYGCNIRSACLSEKYGVKILGNKISYYNALDVKKLMLKNLKINNDHNFSDNELNHFIYTCCLNFCELKNLAAKSNKMKALAEMSMSITLGLIFTISLNIVLLFLLGNTDLFIIIETLILILMSLIFLSRARKYEMFSIRILFRTVYIYYYLFDIQ